MSSSAVSASVSCRDAEARWVRRITERLHRGPLARPEMRLPERGAAHPSSQSPHREVKKSS